MNAPTPSTAVCVLGMSRCGTSLTARVLGLAGVYLGRDEELLQRELHQLKQEGKDVLASAKAANPDGFWEHYELMRLNERILRRLGGNWREPPDPEPGWERSAELAAEREEALELLGRSFGGRPLWGWKDPRNSLTLPFWQELVPNLRYVICLRNPLDVASSLEKRDGLEIEAALRLFQIYLERAMHHTTRQTRLLVPYERYFEEPAAVAQSLARFAGRADAFAAPERSSQLTAVIDQRLWRQRAGATATPDGAQSESVRLYERVLRDELNHAERKATK